MNPIDVSLDDLLQWQAWAKRLPEMMRHKKSSSFVLGAQVSRQRGRGMEFTDVRHYQAGDDIRHMDWRLTAKTGKPYTKLFQEERERPAFVVIDFAPSMHFATRGALKSVLAANVAALFAWINLAEGHRLGGIIRTPIGIQYCHPRARKSGMMNLLQTIVESFRQSDQVELTAPSWNEVLDHLNHLAKPGSLLFFISDWMDLSEQTSARWQALARHHDCSALILSDPIEISVPPAGRYPIHNGQQIGWLDLEDAERRIAYQRYFADRHSAIESLFQSVPIKNQRILTTDSIIDVLADALTRSALRWRDAS